MEPVTAVAQQVSQMGGIAMPVSALYIGLNALFSLLLAILVVRGRVTTGTEIGDGGVEEMRKVTRAHGNNIEYVPLALIVMTAVELTGANFMLVHAIGTLLTFGRVAHALGMYQSLGRSAGRFIGTIATWLAILMGGLILVF